MSFRQGARQFFERRGAPTPSVPTARDYVQNGLVAMWDGIENAGYRQHDPNATVWKDLSGNNMDFPLVEGNSSWLGNALLGASRSAGYIGSLSASSLGTVGFVEFVGNPYYGVGDRVEATPGMILDGATSGSVINLRIRGWASRKVCSILKGSKNCPWYVTPGMGTKSEDRTVYCAGEVSGADVGTVYYNGDEVTPQTFGENFDASPYVCLGAYKTNDTRYPYEGSINCIRIYNRSLTAADVAHNYAVDKARFNLP